MKLRVCIVVFAAVLTSQVAIADSGTVKVCVAGRGMALAIKDLSSTLSEQKLSSGRFIEGIALNYNFSQNLSQDARDSGCEYLVMLYADQADVLRDNQPGLAVGPFPSYHSSNNPNFPKVNYTLTNLGKPVAKARLITNGSYRTDYSALAARFIAHKIK